MSLKPSFFDRLSGTTHTTADPFDEDLSLPVSPTRKESLRSAIPSPRTATVGDLGEDGRNDEGQLPVDVHQTPSDIVIRAFVAGVRPDELNISISRDMVEIAGSRMEREQVSGPDVFTHELF
jgi:HSP20 family molecular chaperone IbpA